MTAVSQDMRMLFTAITDVLMKYQRDCPEISGIEILATLGNVAGFVIAGAPEQDRETAIAHLTQVIQASVPNFVEFIKQRSA